MKDIVTFAGSSSTVDHSPGRPPARGFGLGLPGLPAGAHSVLLAGAHSLVHGVPPHGVSGTVLCIPAMDSSALRVRGPTLLSSPIHLLNLLFMSF